MNLLLLLSEGGFVVFSDNLNDMDFQSAITESTHPYQSSPPRPPSFPTSFPPSFLPAPDPDDALEGSGAAERHHYGLDHGGSSGRPQRGTSGRDYKDQGTDNKSKSVKTRLRNFGD